MVFIGKQTQLEIILSKANQTQKEKYHIFTQTQNLNLKVHVCESVCIHMCLEVMKVAISG